MILGLTFKENCPDIRNSKVADIIKRLQVYGIEVCVVDPWASEKEAYHEYGVNLVKLEEVADADCVILAVAHQEFREMGIDRIAGLFKDVPAGEKVLIDVKGIYRIGELKESGMLWWRL